MNDDTKITCPYCGTLVDQTEEICPQCFAPLKPTQVNAPEPEVPEPVEGPTNPAKQQAKTLAPTAIASLVLGILSISFSVLIIPGIILGSIGKTKANEGHDAIAAYPDVYTGEAMLKAGHATSKAGLILSIVWFIFWGVYFFALAAALHYS